MLLDKNFMIKVKEENQNYVVMEFQLGRNGCDVSRSDGNNLSYEDAMACASRYEENLTSENHVVVITKVEGASDKYHANAYSLD